MMEGKNQIITNKKSEITESVSLMISLSKNKYAYECFSLNIEQEDVIDHLNGNIMNEK